jgi:hypothetical protein
MDLTAGAASSGGGFDRGPGGPRLGAELKPLEI